VAGGREGKGRGRDREGREIEERGYTGGEKGRGGDERLAKAGMSPSSIHDF